MLVLGRKPGECICIGENIKIYITDIRGDKVRVGVEAPVDVTVHRGEVFGQIHNVPTPKCGVR